MKPIWRQAPKWAKYLAQDRDGSWWFFEEKPSPVVDCWCTGVGHQRREAVGENKQWKDTLERRP